MSLWSFTYKSFRFLYVMQQFICGWISNQLAKLVGWFSRNLHMEKSLSKTWNNEYLQWRLYSKMDKPKKKKTVNVCNWPWLLTLFPSHHSFYVPLQIRSHYYNAYQPYKIKKILQGKTSFISTDMMARGSIKYVHEQDWALSCLWRVWNLPSISGSGKVQQTSQFSRKICDCQIKQIINTKFNYI